jgi:hypothetical protein
MSEAYNKAKQLLDQLVYASPSANGTAEAAQQQAAIVPLEQQALFSRLQSFSVTTWFGKPAALSALECAVKGWRNTGPDVLTCDSCGCKVRCCFWRACKCGDKSCRRHTLQSTTQQMY